MLDSVGNSERQIILQIIRFRFTVLEYLVSPNPYFHLREFVYARDARTLRTRRTLLDTPVSS
jgi:hypothetical protein